MRVLLIKAQSAYDAARTFIDDLAQAFCDSGHRATVLDVLGATTLHALERERDDEPVDLIYTINILGDWRDASGRTIAQIVGAPHVLQMVDHPLVHWGRLEQTDPATALLLLDRSHVAAVRSVYGPERFAYVDFSPAGAAGELYPIPEDAEAYVAARPIPILFPATYQTPPSDPWAVFPERVRPILARAVEIMLADEVISALDALEAAMRMGGLDPMNPEFTGFRKLAIPTVNEFVRTYRRVQFLEAAARVGLPLHVYGGGYAEHLDRLKNIRWGGEASLDAILGEMRRARVVMNINANFRDGAHDRPFTAGAAGAATASDSSTYLAEQFRHGEAIQLFSWANLDQGLSDIASLAGDPAQVHAMARAAQRRVVDAHLWRHRIARIVEAAAAARAA